MTRSIESWFDVRVEKALESGVQLGRSALDSLLLDLGEKARSMAAELSDIQESSRRSALLRLREEKASSRWLCSRSVANCCRVHRPNLSSLLPDLPSQSQLKQARSTQMVSTIEG